MAVVEQISHRVAVMYLGQIVEMGPRRAIFETPRHSYTKTLLDAVPIADPRERRDHFRKLSSEIPSPVRPLDFQPDFVALQEIADRHIVAAEPAMAGG